MIWYELSYEFLGFQEILGALSLLFSTTLLVLTIFVKRLKQGAARVRQQAGRQLSVVLYAQLCRRYYQESDKWSRKATVTVTPDGSGQILILLGLPK